MSGDEVFVLLLSGGVAYWSWVAWYIAAASVLRLGARQTGKPVVWLWPLLCMATLFAILKTAASFDVRNDGLYLTFYMVMGAGWIGAITKLLPVVGLSAREDVLERANPAAAPAIAGALLGFTFCFAGGNIGDGPGWWVVVFSAGLATLTLGVLLLFLDRLTGIADTVTIERDTSAGVRLGGLMIATGLILGRAVAGDWISGSATLFDLVRFGWPALVIFTLAALIERQARPTAESPTRSVALLGAPPALLYVAAAVAYVISLGPV